MEMKTFDANFVELRVIPIFKVYKFFVVQHFLKGYNKQLNNYENKEYHAEHGEILREN